MEQENPKKFISYRLRRVRFLENVPQSIQGLTFSESGDKLALCRVDGNMELWSKSNCDGFYQKLRIPGKSSRCVQAITWCGNRLFTGCLSGNIEEWNFITLQPSLCENLGGGPIWCMKSNFTNTLLAAGCENGKVNIIQCSDSASANNAFQWLSLYGQEESRIMSLAWSSDGQFIAFGTASGVIKKINILNGNCMLTITCDRSLACIIWDLVYVGASIVSADSFGTVKFWNDEHGTLLRSFKEHDGDVLSVAFSYQSNVLFSTGVDQKIVSYQNVKDNREWIRGNVVKSHMHDVRAMDLSSTGFLATGGIDTSLNIVKIDHFNAKGVRKYGALQDSAPCFSVDCQAHHIVQQTNTEVKVWTQDDNFSPISRFNLKSNNAGYIVSVAMARNGNKIAVSTVHKLFLYDLMRFFKCLCEIELPSVKMAFNINGSILLLATTTNGIGLLNTENSEYKSILSFEEVHSLLPITAMSTNNDCTYFAVTGSSCQTLLYCINGNLLYKLPLAPHPPLHVFSSACALLIYLSGRILYYNILRNETIEIGMMKPGLEFPKAIYVLDKQYAALLFPECISVFRYYLVESKNQVICCSKFKTSSTLLALSVCNDNSIIIIEQTMKQLLKTLPPVVKKEHYGI